ncbi:MAG: hypothetical protein RLZZ28_1739 [Bacteroidota bacterium]
MKKLIYFLVSLFALLLFCVFLFIPAKIEFSTIVVMPTAENGTQRFVSDPAQWHKWWPVDSTVKNDSGHFRWMGAAYSIQEQQYKSATIAISFNNNHYSSQLILIPLQKDSTIVQWKSSLNAGLNPFKRIRGYQDARQLKSGMTAVLKQLQLFLSKTEHIYGIPIERTGTPDTILVSAKARLAEKPGTARIYAMIQQLQGFANKQGAKQTGIPIYNITKTENGQYQLMCALPIDRKLDNAAPFTIREMVKGAFMKTEVVGGEQRIEAAMASMNQYFIDFQKVAMAIPFIMPVTDRLYQPDTSKWITRLYYPVY